MPRHPPIALKTLDRSHCQCPPGLLPTVLARKTSFSRSVRWHAVKPPIICWRLSVSSDGPRSLRHAFAQRSTTSGGIPPECGTRTNLLFTMSTEQADAEASANLAFRRMTRVFHPSTGSWWSRTGSNRRPPACKAGALPSELRPLIPGKDGGPGRT